ncbi:hypothetical protein [Streptomyces pluripotens]|uniref:hypothetical protein n=1 Tax=Streptomyces sp. MUM 16J TaxID=2791988 RepID=UPI000583FCC9
MLHLPAGRELLCPTSEVQAAGLALNGAWYSRGISRNIGAGGHATLSCSPLHTARVQASHGGDKLRLRRGRSRDPQGAASDTADGAGPGRVGTAAVRRRGRFRLPEAELLLAEGRRTEARTVFGRGLGSPTWDEGART